MPITEPLAGSGSLAMPLEGERHEDDLPGYDSCFRFHDRHGRDHDHFADRVMRDILMFLGRGFALFAGGPAVVYRYQPPRRSAAVVKRKSR
jgi:hypothetical protein